MNRIRGAVSSDSNSDYNFGKLGVTMRVNHQKKTRNANK